MLRGFRALTSFLTRIPMGVFDIGLAAKSFYMVPLVGLLEGIIVFSFLALLLPFVDPSVVSALYVVVHFMLTGGIHVDGFVDYVEALWSGRSGEDMLKIMKDPRKGVYGIAALAINFLISYAGVYAIVKTAGVLELLPMFVALYMFSAESIFITACLGKPEPYKGLGKAFVEEAPRRKLHNLVLAATLFSTLFAATAILVGLRACLGLAAMLASSVLVALYSARTAAKRLGFVNGDVLGFAYEFSRLVGLVVGGVFWR